MHHCTKCIRQFKALKPEIDEVGEEQYEVCPHCGNDIFLGEGELPAELLKTLTDKNKTKELKPEKIWFKSKEQWEADEEARYQKEDAALENYLLRTQQQNEDAERLYFEELKTN